MNDERRHRAEFGDWQTPDELALATCHKLTGLGIHPRVVIEPTCGLGAFVLAAHRVFPDVQAIDGFEVNSEHLAKLKERLAGVDNTARVQVHNVDFFLARLGGSPRYGTRVFAGDWELPVGDQ